MGGIPIANPSPPRLLRFPRREIVIGLALASVVGVLVVALVFAWPNSGTPSRVFTAGLVEDFQPGTVSYFEDRHVFVVRMPDGTIIALSDSAQHLEGETVEWRPDFEFQGMRGWFRSPTHQETFAMDGTLAFGPARTDMVRFPIAASDGRLQIDTTQAICADAPAGIVCLDRQDQRD